MMQAFLRVLHCDWLIFTVTKTFYMEQPTSVTSLLTPITISLQDGIAWTTNWRESGHQLSARSFTLGGDEFAAILNEPGVEQVRLYLALAVDPDNPPELIEKLICVGVDRDGKDIIYGPENPRPEGDEGTGIYDFSNPCPPLCNPNNSSSPLN